MEKIQFFEKSSLSSFHTPAGPGGNLRPLIDSSQSTVKLYDCRIPKKLKTREIQRSGISPTCLLPWFLHYKKCGARRVLLLRERSRLVASDFLENKYWLEKNSVKPGTQNIWRYISNRPLNPRSQKAFSKKRLTLFIRALHWVQAFW